MNTLYTTPIEASKEEIHDGAIEDLAAQGLIRDRRVPRQPYSDWPEPEVSVKALQSLVLDLLDRVSQLEHNKLLSC